MKRDPIVAGQFYPGSKSKWEEQVRSYLAQAKSKDTSPAILVMAPHAGYMFSGSIAGQTIGRANLSKTVVMLGVNHTGRGAGLGVWAEGSWEVPGASLPVEKELAADLISRDSGFTADFSSHSFEHSLEVMIPFLWAVEPETEILPISVGEPGLDSLQKAGETLAQCITDWKDPVSILVSSDMSHYISHHEAQQRDTMALDRAVALDPDGLYQTVRSKGISMCGVLPMTLGLFAANTLGAREGELVGYATSGDVSGDYQQVVGYAGVIVR